LTDALAVCCGVEVVYRRGGEVVQALVGIDLTVDVHDSLALLGRSGSGKTTLLHVLGGLVRPTAGQVERPAHGIAYVFQASNLLPHFTAIENVAFARHVASDEIRGTLAVRELLELVGLSGKAESLPSELSGGEAQRVAIARALAQEPRLLLCDEPTGHLDTDTGERVLDLIDALQRELRFALVVATHDTDLAQRLRRSVELNDGRVVIEVAV
jgi:putative ABC transport system ATP-binding protein